MIIKFNDIDQVEAFLNITQTLKSDVIVGEGNVQVDGKSPVGMMGLDLRKEYPVYLLEKEKNNELSIFVKQLMTLGIVK